MRPGWYIVNYHDVSYENSILTRALKGTLRPDLFRSQIAYLSELGEFCSLEQGVERLRTGRLDRPYISLWFDDGYAGLKHHAKDLCSELGIRPIVSVCSRFVLRQELFWRCKLSALVHLDGLRLLRSKLRRSFDAVPFKVRKWTLENYDERVQRAVDEAFEEVTTEAFRADAFRIFLSEDDLHDLRASGWDIVNHSAGHTPWSKSLGWDRVRKSFEEAEGLLQTVGGDSRFWVVPFDFGFEHYAEQARALGRVLVLVGDRPNRAATWDGSVLQRYAAIDTYRYRGFLG